jgi:4-amino-4-deoxy-L-arabinose transferase-like glycosyltransferase
VGKRLNPRVSNVVVCLAVLAVAVGLKAILLDMDAFPFNADEAIVGLMARHILDGRWPTFFYGQAYMGSLDAILVAFAMAAFGTQVLAIRIVQVLLYAGTVVTTMVLGWQIYRSRWAGWAAGLLMAMPSVNVTLYTTVSLGGYGEALLIGNLILILTLKIDESPDSSRLYVLWGALAGLGFWTFGLTLIYSLPCGIFIFWKALKHPRRRKAFLHLVLLSIAVAIGALPWTVWAVSHGPGQLLEELMGSAIAGASSGTPLGVILSRIRYFTLLGTSVIFGLRPPWEVRWLALPLLPFALAFWMVVSATTIAAMKRRGGGKVGKLLLLGVGVCLILGYILTPFGADPSGRYFIPLAVPLSLFAAEFLVKWRPAIRKEWCVVLILGILTYNLWGTLQAALRNPPGITTQFNAITRIDHRYDEMLIEFLTRQGETRGYSNYWVAYPLAFLSEERLIYVPKLPYHHDFRYTPRDDRYEPYDEQVATADRVAYITTNHDPLDQFLRDEFHKKDIRWLEVRIGDYHVFYNLEPAIHIEDMNATWLVDGSLSTDE